MSVGPRKDLVGESQLIEDCIRDNLLDYFHFMMCSGFADLVYCTQFTLFLLICIISSLLEHY